MSVDTRPVPTTLLRWPRTRDLITQHKFILLYLWPNPDQTACGCYLLGVESSAADMSMTPGSLVDAINEFKRRELIDVDMTTGEIFLRDWFRFYQPRSQKAVFAVVAAISRVASSNLRQKVQIAYESMLEATKEKEKGKGKVYKEAEARHAPAAPAPSASAAAPLKSMKPATPNLPHRKRWGEEQVLHGVVIWTTDDEARVLELVDKYGAAEVEAAAAVTPPALQQPAPYRSAVESTLQQKATKAAKEAAEAALAAKVHDTPPVDKETGHARAAALRARIAGRRPAAELEEEGQS